MLRLHNPHSVLAALETRPKDVTEIGLPPGAKGLSEGWERVVKLAQSRGVRTGVASKPREGRDGARDGGREAARDAGAGRTSSTEAVVREREPVSLEELFADAREKKGGKGLWLALDCLQDPQNVGAIFRSAAFFGVQGIVLTQERSAPLTSAVYDIASGGLEHVPFASEINLQRAFEKAKDAGLWILGTSEHANDDVAKIDRDRPWLLVIGNEEKGMRRLTEESCDVLCKISAQGKVTSLNASVATGILISSLS